MFLSFCLNSLGSSRSLTSFGSLFQSWLALKVNNFRYSSVIIVVTIITALPIVFLQGRVVWLLEQCTEVVRELTELMSTVPAALKEDCMLLLPKECPKLLLGEEGEGLLQGAVEELSVRVCMLV